MRLVQRARGSGMTVAETNPDVTCSSPSVAPTAGASPRKRHWWARRLGVAVVALSALGVPAGAGSAGATAGASGSWGTVQKVPGLAALNVGETGRIKALSCPLAGNCAAVGNYADASGLSQAFVVDEVGGSWGRAHEVPGSSALGVLGGLTSVSCSSAGDCAAGGVYRSSSGSYQAFVVDEVQGSWRSAQEVPGL